MLGGGTTGTHRLRGHPHAAEACRTVAQEVPACEVAEFLGLEMLEDVHRMKASSRLSMTEPTTVKAAPSGVPAMSPMVLGFFA